MRRVDRLTGALLEDGHLSGVEHLAINAEPTLTEQADHLLRVLNNKSPQAFHCLLHALVETKQAPLFHLLTIPG